jgi:hypothetical protein
MKRAVRPPNWKLQLNLNTERLKRLSARLLEETDEHARFKLVCRADGLLDERLRIDPPPVEREVA